MKKYISSLFISIILMNFYILNTFSQDHYADLYSNDDSFYNQDIQQDTEYQYEDGEITEPNKARYISPNEFNSAIKTIEKYGLTNKQKKKIQEKNKIEEANKSEEAKPLKPTTDALLRLPAAIFFDGKNIKAGFYLLSHKLIDGENFVILKKGQKELLAIPVIGIEKQTLKIIDSFTEIESIDTNNINIVLNTKYSKLKLVLPRTIK